MWVTASLLVGALVAVAACVRADDLDTIRERRKPFVVASALNVDSAPSWLDTLTADGTWPDADYTAGAARAGGATNASDGVQGVQPSVPTGLPSFTGSASVRRRVGRA